MIEWENVDLMPLQLDCEGNPYLLLDKSVNGPLYRIRLGFPDKEEHLVVRIKRGSFRNRKNSGQYEKLKSAGADLKAMAVLLGLKPISEIKKVKGVLPEALQRNTGSFYWGQSQLYTYAAPANILATARPLEWHVNYVHNAQTGTWLADIESYDTDEDRQ